MTESPIRIMLVDDHFMVRMGLQRLLEMDGRFTVVAQAGTAAEAVAAVTAAEPAIVLMDVRLPDRSGVEACREIRALRPETRVVMLTSYPDDEAVAASVLAGASGYLLKELNQDALIRSLLIAAQGGSLLEPELVAGLLERLKAPKRGDGLEQVTAQERQILSLIAGGQTNRQIGETLFLSENTVKNYVSRLLEKLGLSRRSEAAAYLARREGRGDTRSDMSE